MWLLYKEFKLDDIIDTSLEALSDFIVKSSKNRFDDPTLIADKIKKAARSSFRLSKTAYDLINLSLASSINVIKCYENEIKEIDEAIILQVDGFNKNHFDVLLSIPGIGKVYAAGILAEIADINQFDSDDKLGKFAGIIWRNHPSGSFEGDDTQMTKTCNKYLRYFLIKAANMARIHNPVYISRLLTKEIQ
ncbi:transposase [Acholeplasma laidlawii]|uniref:transposase n=1 Tax=Acholeplasma laidlawii TaxID=2148 RepID=UPI0021F76BD7|nr:transposase [Acholeplasma laidlawii]